MSLTTNTVRAFRRLLERLTQQPAEDEPAIATLSRALVHPKTNEVAFYVDANGALVDKAGGGVSTTGTILVNGNSISIGGGLTDWTQVLAAMPNPVGRSVIVNNAVSGETLATTIANYATRVAPYVPALTGRPLLVVLPCAGASDIYGGTTAAATYQLIKDFVALVHASGGRIMVGTVTPGQFFIDNATDTARQTLNTSIGSDLTQFDFFWPLDRIFRQIDQVYFGVDHQHLSQSGHHMMALQFLEAATGAYNDGFVATGVLALKELIAGILTDGFKSGGLRLEGIGTTGAAKFGINTWTGTGMLCTELAPEGWTIFSNATFAIIATLLNTGYFGIKRLYFDGAAAAGPFFASGAATPEGAITAPVGSVFLRTDGGATTTLYVKTSGTGNTGWTGK